MPRRATRRRCLREAAGVAVAAAGLAGAAAPDARAARAGASADCEAAIDANATEDGEPKLELPAAETAVTGESTCDPGAELDVTLRNVDGETPFKILARAKLADDGSWRAAVDLSSVDPGTTFTTSVVDDEGEVLDSLERCEVVVGSGETATDPGGASRTPTPTPTDSPGTPATTAPHTTTAPPTPGSHTPMRTDSTRPPGEDGGDGRSPGGWLSGVASLVAWVALVTVVAPLVLGGLLWVDARRRAD